MASFTPTELEYLQGERRLGRLATADANGMPHVVPVGWRYNPDADTIDVSGRNFGASKKYRNVQGNGQASFVVDDLASTDPWHPRFVMVQGRAQAMAAGEDGGTEAFIRITPDKVVSMGLTT
jgi:PPOX class F420-dependent enzyme/OxyR family protein